eukprot:evm.model.scf_784EXC.4 EVM.evm.TU.scf_784EXC.4   scf_784EXC:48965-56206(+)
MRLNHGSQTLANPQRPAVQTPRLATVPPRSRSLPKVPRSAAEIAQPVKDGEQGMDMMVASGGGLRAVVQSVLGQLGGMWPGKETEAEAGKGPAVDLKAFDSEKEIIKINEKLKEQKPKAPLDITRCLHSVPTSRVMLARSMSSLCSLSYRMDRITPRLLWHHHRLHFVTSSLSWKRSAEEAEQAQRAMLFGDGMATMPPEDPPASKAADVDERSNNIVAIEEKLRQLPALDKKSAPGPWNGTTKVVAEATMFAAISVSSAAGSLYQQALYQIAKQAANAASAGQVMDSVSRVLSVVYATLAVNGPQRRGSPDPAVDDSEAPKPKMSRTDFGRCPYEWYVADNPEHDLRLFVIQGSVGLDTWQTNLTFDPVVFEDEAFGVRVHRGAYESAKALYAFFEPLVKDHLESSPNAKICFTGHSLGGSLATVVMLMFVHRGVLPPEAVHSVFTFGGAAVFCEGAAHATDCANCALAASCELPRPTPDPKGLLSRLGLPRSTVTNVMMHNDIVPKAWACDFSPVLPIMRSMGASFRDHSCLGATRATLYNFIGDLLVLQPADRLSLVQGDGYHGLLPEGADLLAIDEPKGPGGWGVAERGEARDRREAVMSIMDSPHPLEILADPRSYGASGKISRYHNPDSYTKALKSVAMSRSPGEVARLVKAVLADRMAAGGKAPGPRGVIGPRSIRVEGMNGTSYARRRARRAKALRRSAEAAAGGKFRRGSRTGK